MDSESDPGSVALLAIKPRFADAIIAGRKTVEFRKTRFSQPPRYVVLYASTPVRQIVAYFKVAYIKELTPLGLWRKFRHVGAIEHDEFFDYYDNCSLGYAIVVATVWKLGKPARLGHLRPRGAAPQSFRYLNKSSIRRLSERR
ncbi:MAG: ASCH domain-containing protein [Chthoniobacterales bacterium]|nr:ASCH domain-containing protein [Chthoniobacterales bacterium]